MAYLNSREDIPAVIAELTLDEKIKLITTPSVLDTYPIERLGIPSIRLQDGGTGVNFTQLHMHAEDRLPRVPGFRNFQDLHYYTVHPDEGTPEIKELMAAFRKECEAVHPGGELPGCFPAGMLLGATWDPETVYNTGNALAREMDSWKVDVILGTPNVNILRVPRNGRLFEGYSEDPCLASTLAPAFVRGVQDTGVCANVKHYAVNNQETERSGINTIVSKRALYEIYFPGFKGCVDAGCMTVMSAYNKLNGEACAQNRWLLTDVLRDEWGFTGCVDSDWGAVYDQVEALNAGNDLEQPKPRSLDAIYAALQDGRLSEKTIDTAVEHFLNLVLATPAKNGRRYPVVDNEYSRKMAYNAAVEAATLLKNNGALPIRDGANICFYGQCSKELFDCGGGSAEVMTNKITQIYAETVKLIGAEHVTFETILPETDVVVAVAGLNSHEGADRPDMRLQHEDEDMLRRAIAEAKAAGKPLVLVLNIAGPVDLREFVEDVDAILCIWLPGMEGGRATADLLLGRKNPSGKLPLTFPKREEDAPCYLSFPGEAHEVTYGEGIFVGYRYYDKKDIDPLYPFGFGLSYTQFSFSDLQFSTEQWETEKDPILRVSCTVTNTGKLDGKEVVQLYIRDEVSRLIKPVRELKAFRKVFVKAGESVRVDFELDKSRFASWDPLLEQWAAEPGWFTIELGNSSRNLPLQGRVRLIGINPYAVMPDEPAGTLVTDPRAVAILKKYLPAELVDEFVDRVAVMPVLSLAMFWRFRFAKALEGTKEEKEAIREQLFAELSGLSIIE